MNPYNKRKNSFSNINYLLIIILIILVGFAWMSFSKSTANASTLSQTNSKEQMVNDLNTIKKNDPTLYSLMELQYKNNPTTYKKNFNAYIKQYNAYVKTQKDNNNGGHNSLDLLPLYFGSLWYSPSYYPAYGGNYSDNTTTQNSNNEESNNTKNSTINSTSASETNEESEPNSTISSNSGSSTGYTNASDEGDSGSVTFSDGGFGGFSGGGDDD